MIKFIKGLFNMGIGSGWEISIKSKLGSNSEYVMFDVKKPGGYTFNVVITRWPTGNCQLSSFGYMNSLLQYTKYNGTIQNAQAKEDAQAILKECYRLIAHVPKLVLVDVRSNYVPEVEQCFPVVHKHPYASTNGSSMCLFLLDCVALSTVKTGP